MPETRRTIGGSSPDSSSPKQGRGLESAGASTGSLPFLPVESRRTDHLGLSVKASHSRYKYARTFTCSFDHRKTNHASTDDLHYSLTRDARKVADLSIPALTQMFALFSDTLEQGMTLVGPKTFRLVLGRCGIQDEVLNNRLFQGFAEEHNGERVDFRDFMRALVRASTARATEKLALLFRVYDIDRSGSLSLPELTLMIRGSSRTARADEQREQAQSPPPPTHAMPQGPPPLPFAMDDLEPDADGHAVPSPVIERPVRGRKRMSIERRSGEGSSFRLSNGGTPASADDLDAQPTTPNGSPIGRRTRRVSVFVGGGSGLKAQRRSLLLMQEQEIDLSNVTAVRASTSAHSPHARARAALRDHSPSCRWCGSLHACIKHTHPRACVVRARVRTQMLDRVWRTARDLQNSAAKESEEWIATNRQGIMVEFLVQSCKHKKHINKFFEQHLTMQPPTPKDDANSGGGNEGRLRQFYRRLEDLEREIKAESLGVKSRDKDSRSATPAPASAPPAGMAAMLSANRTKEKKPSPRIQANAASASGAAGGGTRKATFRPGAQEEGGGRRNIKDDPFDGRGKSVLAKSALAQSDPALMPGDMNRSSGRRNSAQFRVVAPVAHQASETPTPATATAGGEVSAPAAAAPEDPFMALVRKNSQRMNADGVTRGTAASLERTALSKERRLKAQEKLNLLTDCARLIPRPDRGELARPSDPKVVLKMLNEHRKELGIAPMDATRVEQALARSPRKEQLPSSRSMPALPKIETASWK